MAFHDLSEGQAVGISGLGHTKPSDPGMHLVSNEDFITSLNAPGQTQLFMNERGGGIFIPRENQELIKKKALEWEHNRPGIRSRLITSLSTEELAIMAAQRALTASRLKASHLDAIIVSSNTKDRLYPKLSGGILASLPGFSSATSCTDLSGSCADGGLMLLHGAALIRSGMARHVLCVAAERPELMSGRDNYKAGNLWGSGAGAVVLSARRQPGITAIATFDDPDNREHIRQDVQAAPYSPMWYGRWGENQNCARQVTGPFVQNGPEVQRWVGKYIVPEAVAFILTTCDPPETIKAVICHQASGSVLDLLEDKLTRQIPALRGKFYRHVETHGNSSSASTIVALSELVESGELKTGDRYIQLTFGAGLQAVFLTGLL